MEVVVEFFALQATAEFLAHRVIRQVGDVPDHPRQHQAAFGDHAAFLERATVKFRVGENGLAGHLVERDVLCRQLGCRGDCQAVAHAVRIADGPLQRLHAAQAAANHCGPGVDAEQIGQPGLAVDPVFHGHHREVGAERLAGIRINAARPGRTVATAQIVEADDKELFGVDRLAGTDTAVPPTGFAVVGAMETRSMVMPGQRMTDQHGIAACGVELTVGFVNQVIGWQRTTAGQRQRLAEMCRLRCDQSDRIVGEYRGHRPCSRVNEA